MEQFVLTDEDEQKVQEGQAAAALLDSSVFLLAIDRIRNQCAEGILSSDPNAVAVREGLYNLSRGLSAVTEELLQMQASAESILENAALTTQSDEDVQAEEPDVQTDY